jgi:hypothetical protein
MHGIKSVKTRKNYTSVSLISGIFPDQYILGDVKDLLLLRGALLV